MKINFLLFMFICSGVYAQTNLVNNPGFESYTQCTSSYNQILYCIGWTGVPGCSNISDVADYFNGCGTSGYSPPAISPAWQIPHGGNSYIGITSANNLGNCREYAETMLLNSLIPGVKYNVSYYVNLGGNAFFSLASNKLGALFTTYQIPDNVSLQPLNFAHVYTDSVITDTVGWYHFSESFIADSSYNYMTIGNFFDSAHVITIPLQSGSSYAWYLIDDVYVGIDSSGIIPTVNLNSSDTFFCERHCIDFHDLSTNNPTSWQWSFPGADHTSSTLQNPSSICYNNYGSFDVTLIACNSFGCDSIFLPGFINEQVSPTPNITQSNDTLFASPGVSYQWWDLNTGIIAGAVNNYFIVSHGGDYYVVVTDTIGCDGFSNIIYITGLNIIPDNRPLFSIVPNPNTGIFNFRFNYTNKKDASISIIDPLGQTVYSRNIQALNQNQLVELTNIAKGIYAAKVILEGKIYSGRFIVE